MLYARAALNAQAEGSEPFAAQLAAMREYVTQRNWAIVVESVDTYSNNPPGLQSLLATVEEHTFDIVLVYNLVCLSESIFDTLAIFELLG